MTTVAVTSTSRSVPVGWVNVVVAVGGVYSVVILSERGTVTGPMAVRLGAECGEVRRPGQM